MILLQAQQALKAANKKPANVEFAGFDIVAAVRAGFEPAVQSYPYGSLANY